MLGTDRAYMLAADHRWQWEEWCDRHHVSRARIPEIKALALEGFLRARTASEDVAAAGSMLLDAQYAAASLASARAAGVTVGAPAERPGAFPLRWATVPVDRALTGEFVKVLVRHRPDYGRDVIEGQRSLLAELASWCRSHCQPLLVEVLVPRADEPEEAFEAEGRAAIVADYIRGCYAQGLVPDFWKMEGTRSVDAARLVDDAVRERIGPRFLVLGKAASLAIIADWFAAARTMTTAAGFAIGRSVYWDPATAWLEGTLARDRAVQQIADTYCELVHLWKEAR
jgi:5-dehydro-2-deoxygluconokinase